MDAAILSRLQFAFTIGYHILWPTLTIGLAAFVAWSSMLWWWTGRPVYRDLMRFWMQLFALGFGMGVITGVVMSYEIGTNWAGFSRAVGNVLGPLFMYEAATAFFLESGFVGIMLFAEGRVSRGLHLFACVMVALGSLISASWILAANSWMQTPAGAVADADGIFHVVSWWNVVFNPSFPFRFMHMVCASFLTGAFVVAGVSAFQLLRGSFVDTSRIGLSMAMWAALLLAPLQIALGDRQGLNTAQYQPAKLAAMEGLWDTEHNVPATLFAWPDMAAEKNLYEISVPHLASLYLTHSWDGEVQGLKATPPENRPYVPLVFFAFRIMVGIGMLLLGLAITSAVLRWRGRLYDARWFHYAAVAATPLGFLAVLAGWTVTETGRQPFVVYGLMRTADAASPVSPGAVTASLIGFLLVYAILFISFLWFAGRLAFRGSIAMVPVRSLAIPGTRACIPRGRSAPLPLRLRRSEDVDIPVVFALLAVFGVAVYVLADGFDLGVGILSFFAPRETDRDLMMASIEPVWDGNETWLVFGGTLLFAAFPAAYYILLPAFYLPIMLMLFALISRGIAFAFRDRAGRSRRIWDFAFAGGSLLAAFAQGLVLGGFIGGVDVQSGIFHGSPLSFLSFLGVLCGLGLIGGYALMGAGWLIWKTDGQTQVFAREIGHAAVILTAAMLAVVSAWTALSEPQVADRWFSWPNIAWLAPIPLISVAALVATWRALWSGPDWRVFVLSALIFLLGFFGLAVSLWPYVVPRHITIWNGAADPQTLWFVGIGLCFILPIVLAYQFHAYWVFRGKTVIVRTADDGRPALAARRSSSPIAGLHLS